jgi:5-hydroxyisourate hydrolase
MTSPVTTHVLDTARGKPAAGVVVVLEQETAGGFARVGNGVTDADGRVRTLLKPGSLGEGVYRITFEVGGYFRQLGVEAFWRDVSIEFVVRDASGHFHVPLLVSPFGYSTYRGS